MGESRGDEEGEEEPTPVCTVPEQLPAGYVKEMFSQIMKKFRTTCSSVLRGTMECHGG